MSGSGKEIQIGDYVDIRRDDMIIGFFEIIDFERRENSIVIILVSDEGDEIILELSPDLDKIIFLSDMFDIDDVGELSVNFIGFNPDFLQGLECDTSKDFDKTVKILKKFWSRTSNQLNLIGLRCNMDVPRYFSHPRIINKLIRLKLLDNELKSLPPEIGNLQNLQILDLEKNELTSLPETIGNLHNLQDLNLEHNKLTSLPETIGNLHNLKYLDVSYNALTFLPGTIGNLHNLQYLYLGNNELTFLPLELGNIPTIRCFNINGNPLEPGTPKTIPELREAWETYLEQIRNVKSARKT